MIYQSGLGHSAELLSDNTCVRWADCPLTVALHCIVFRRSLITACFAFVVLQISQFRKQEFNLLGQKYLFFEEQRPL